MAWTGRYSIQACPIDEWMNCSTNNKNAHTQGCPHYCLPTYELPSISIIELNATCGLWNPNWIRILFWLFEGHMFIYFLFISNYRCINENIRPFVCRSGADSQMLLHIIFFLAYPWPCLFIYRTMTFVQLLPILIKQCFFYGMWLICYGGWQNTYLFCWD